MGRVSDVVKIPQSCMATAASRPPYPYIRDIVNSPSGFDQSAMLASYRLFDWYDLSTGCVLHLVKYDWMFLNDLYKMH